MSENRLDQFQARLGHVFADRTLLVRALTHASHGEGRVKGEDNQRLEFLGDRVLGLLAAEALVAAFADHAEGELAPRLNALVCRGACAQVARAMQIGPALNMGVSEASRGGRDKDSILADACEAVMAALYLDAGLEAARVVFDRFWRPVMETLDRRPLDPKSALQEQAAIHKLTPPEYAVIHREGPEHRPAFTVEVRVTGLGSATGQGGSKREAERHAAQALLAQLMGEAHHG